jgi:hypothetical protein
MLVRHAKGNICNHLKLIIMAGLPLGQGNYKLSILKTPNNRYKFVGSIPAILCIEKKTSLGLPYMDSPVYDTEQELKDFYKERMGEEFK